VGVSIQDPAFKKGTEPLTVITHENERLRVYEGSKKVIFPSKKKKKRSIKRSISGASIAKSDTNTDFSVLIKLNGLVLRIRESKGVMTVAFIKRPAGSDRYVGLLGIPDGDDTNDFTASNGIVLNPSSYGMSVSERYKGIFYDFGQTWMVLNKDSSLFKRLSVINKFENFHHPEFVPDFSYFGECEKPGACNDVSKSLQESCNEKICGNFTGYIRESCCYDYAVTNDAELTESIMVDVKEEDTIQTILNNSVPICEYGKDKSTSVKVMQKTFFLIKTYDKDYDIVTAELERNDLLLFNLSTISYGYYNLSFVGTQKDGTSKAHVAISDGKSRILFTASVRVASPPCVNDKSYRYDGVQKKSCVWVGKKKARRQTFCSENAQVRVACRMTCGLCCKDDQSYVYDIGNGVIKKL